MLMVLSQHTYICLDGSIIEHVHVDGSIIVHMHIDGSITVYVHTYMLMVLSLHMYTNNMIVCSQHPREADVNSLIVLCFFLTIALFCFICLTILRASHPR